MRRVDGADKRKARARIHRLSQVKTWQLLIIFLMMAFVSATFLRLNNVGMIERREAVFAADKAGDEIALASRVYDLQRYVSEHMNTDTDRIALEHTYQRASQRHKEAYQEKTAATTGGDAFAQAEAICGPIARAQGWRWPDMRYTNCLSDELNKIPGGEAVLEDFQPLPTEPYYHTFSSPGWSPDFAGWSLVLTGVVGLIIIARWIALGFLKLIIRRQRQF